MANVKLKKKKEDGGYEQLYPQTLAKNVITGTGNAQQDILNLMIKTQELEKTNIPLYKGKRSITGTNVIYTIDADKSVLSDGFKFKVLVDQANSGNATWISFSGEQIRVNGTLKANILRFNSIYSFIYIDSKLYIENIFSETTPILFGSSWTEAFNGKKILEPYQTSWRVMISPFQFGQANGLMQVELSIGDKKEYNYIFPTSSLRNVNGNQDGYWQKIYFLIGQTWKYVTLGLKIDGSGLYYIILDSNIESSDDVNISSIKVYQ